MDRVRIGTTFRAIRLEMGLRQADVAAKARTSQQTVSRIERGRFGPVSTDILAAVAEALEADLTLALKWRGPSLPRLLDRRHARLQERVVQLLADGWEIHTEQSFNHFGDRGDVDILGWRADRRALLIIETKPELVDLQETIRILDMKARVVPTVVRASRGWKPESVAAVLVLPDAHVHRAAVAEYAAMLAAALPGRTWAVRQWIDEPHGDLRAIWFVPNTPQVSTKHNLDCTRRVSSKRRAHRVARAGAPGCRPSVETARDRLPGPAGPTRPSPDRPDRARDSV